MIKRLEPVQEITKDDLREWKRQALDWGSGDALGALNMAIYAIFHGSAGYAIVDDETSITSIVGSPNKSFKYPT